MRGEDVLAALQPEAAPHLRDARDLSAELARRVVRFFNCDGGRPLSRAVVLRPVLEGRARESAARPAADESAARRAINTRPWAIQVGAFSERRAARRLAEALRDEYPVEVLPARREGGRWRVRVQPIESEARARSLAETLKREEILPTWVTPMEGRAG